MQIDKNSKTYKNLEKAFEGEVKAYTKYQFYGSQAKKDGYVKIQKIFDETAHNEKEHAEIWFKLLKEGMPSTEENLLDGIAGEHYEYSDMYLNFAEDAAEEGYTDIARLFKMVASIEKSHCERYEELLESIRNNEIFHDDEVITWKCENCGYECIGNDAPEKCPCCKHPQAYFVKKD